jgi:hypothetical protein
MSAGAVGIIGIGVVGLGVAAAAGMAAGAACAAVLGGSASLIGRQLERNQAAHAARAQHELSWDTAVADVSDRNARIGSLQAAVGQPAGSQANAHGPVVVLPPVLVLGSQTLDELADWCRTTDAALAVAEREVVAQTTQRLLNQASAGASTRLVATVHHEISADQPRTLKWDPAAQSTEVERILSRLLPGVVAADHGEVVVAASRVLESVTRGEGRIRMDDLRYRVQTANDHARRRAEDAVQAASLLQPLAHLGVEAKDLREELNEVVAGRRPLDDALRARAVDAATALRNGADRQYVVQAVEEALAELGFSQEEGFQTAEPHNGVLQVKHGNWLAHGVRMLMDDQQKELRAVVVRTATNGGWDESRVDREREEQWCKALPRLGELLAARGVTYRVRELVEPGARATPLLLSAPAAVERQVERARERPL